MESKKVGRPKLKSEEKLVFVPIFVNPKKKELAKVLLKEFAIKNNLR